MTVCEGCICSVSSAHSAACSLLMESGVRNLGSRQLPEKHHCVAPNGSMVPSAVATRGVIR